MLISWKTNRIGIFHLFRSIQFHRNDLTHVLRAKSIRFVSQNRMFLRPLLP